MEYFINLFGYNLDGEISVDNDKLTIDISEENQRVLKQYIFRVSPNYGRETSSASSLQLLLELAIDAEKTLDGRMSEPKLKLPYEFQPEIKEKLIEAAYLQEISATQLLVRLIEKISRSHWIGGLNCHTVIKLNFIMMCQPILRNNWQKG